MFAKKINKIVSLFPIVLIAACNSKTDMPTEVCMTDALDSSLWQQSCWISAANAPVITTLVTEDEFRAADGASWFVSSLTNEKQIKNARWMTTGLGVFQLFVNGQMVGEEFLKPGFTHWQKTRCSFTYDITALLAKNIGEQNTLSAQVTPGWWADKIITPAGQVGMNGQKPAFRAVLEFTYADGSQQYYGTNLTDWQAGVAGPVTHAAIYDGEAYDARILPGYETPELLTTPEENHEFEGEIIPTSGAEIYLRYDLEMKPLKAYTWNAIEGATAEAFGKVVINHEYQTGEEIFLQPGENLVLDFGQNAAAIPSFCFKAAEGTQLTCLPAELLNDGNGAHSRGMDGPEGSVHRLNLRIPEGIQLSYIFGKTDDYAYYQPTCTFFGYRYLSLSATHPVSIKQILSIPVSSMTQELETGTIETGNADVNKIISNTLWGQRSNYLSVPTDCPQRNERLGWTADTQVFSETGTFFANTASFFHKWMRDMRDTQTSLGGFPGVAPVAQYGAEPNGMMRLGWADAGIIVPWTIWKQFNDASIIEENWEAMERFIKHVSETRYDHEALIAENGGYQYADWLSYEPLESCGGDAFSSGDRLAVQFSVKPEALTYWNFLSACYWIMDAEMMRDMAEATGHDTQYYLEMSEEARCYAKDKFLKTDGNFKLDILNEMQTPALFALKNHLVEGVARDAMTARLRQNFTDHGNCLQTGFLGTSILMPTLTQNGMTDVAYSLLLQRNNPSWLYSIDNGATTMWERWNSYMLEHGMGPKGMNSFNHYAYGCVCQWLWEHVAGICADPSQPGFKHIIMAPQPDKRLGYVNAIYPSSAGLIKSEWHYEGDKWYWSFTIPTGATASVLMPGETDAKEYVSGTYTLSN